jgi:VWFA-related protein
LKSKANKVGTWSRLVILGVAGLVGLRCGLFAQNSPFRLQVEVSLIPLDIVVYDADSKPVNNLTVDDFLVFENGDPQPIQHFEPMDAAYNTLLLFDVSGSTEGQLPFMLQASNRFLNNVRTRDLVAVASFDSVVTRLVNWRSRSDMSQTVHVPFRRGGTDLYSALRWAAQELRPMSGRKGVIVLTDGLDQRLYPNQPSAASEQQEFQSVLQAVQESRAPFYFVAMNAVSGPVGGNYPPAKAMQRMQTLAGNSGGRVLLPQTIQDIASLYEGIARELSASYSVAYGSTRPQQDGTYRRIEVRMKNPGLRVSQSRNGYYATNSKTSDKPVTSAAPSNPTGMANATTLMGQPPVLVTPIEQALLSPPQEGEWRFNWEEVPEASKYEIAIHAPNTAAPVIKAETRGTRYAVSRTFRDAGFNANGWSWQVRAQHPNGVWTPWSENRPFDIYR